MKNNYFFAEIIIIFEYNILMYMYPIKCDEYSYKYYVKISICNYQSTEYLYSLNRIMINISVGYRYTDMVDTVRDG